jgi:hypothetical protein
MRDDSKPLSPPHDAVRLPYLKPRLQRYGALTEITYAVNVMGATDNAKTGPSKT